MRQYLRDSNSWLIGWREEGMVEPAWDAAFSAVLRFPLARGAVEIYGGVGSGSSAAR